MASSTTKSTRTAPVDGETSRLGRPHPSMDPGPAISRPISAVTPVSQPTKSATTVTQPTPTPPSAATNSPSDPGPAATVTTTTLPEPGTLLSGDASTNDARGWANAQWSGTAHYAPGPHAGTETFVPTVPTGLPFRAWPNSVEVILRSASISITTETASAAHPVDLIGYRTACALSDFFDVRLGATARPAASRSSSTRHRGPPCCDRAVASTMALGITSR